MVFGSGVRWSGAGVLVVIVAGAGALVAIGATGTGLILPAAQLPDGTRLAVRLAGAAAVAAGVAALLVQRRRSGEKEDPRSDPTVSALVAAGMIMGVLAALALIAPRAGVGRDPAGEDVINGEVAREEASDAGQPNAREGLDPRERFGFPAMGAGRDGRGARGVGGAIPDFGAGDFDPRVSPWRFRILLLGVLLAMAAVIGLLAVRRRLADGLRDVSAEAPVGAADAEAGLQASLDLLAYEGGDPRRQIAAAYERLLTALAEAGAPRQPQEAPHEHLNRALGPLGVSPEPMHRLAELYVLAQFSVHPITDAYRIAATEALEAGLTGLRAANPAQAPAGRGSPLEGAVA